MNLEVLDTAVVAIAKDHNPTILHPSFLVSQEIVPNKWKWIDESVVCTPAFSAVRFENGIQFTVENNKFQVLEGPVPTPFSSSQVPDLARKYINKLEYVRYTAIGLNISTVLHSPKPENLLIEKFLTSGDWNKGNLKLKALALKFVYPLEKGVLNLSLDPGKIQREGENFSGVIVKANYHTNLESENKLEEANEAVSEFSNRCDHFMQTIRRIFGLEEGK